MAKKSLAFAAMVVLCVIGILCLLGSTRMAPKKEIEKKTVRMPIPQIQREVKIVAVEEKKPPQQSLTRKEEKKAASAQPVPPAPKAAPARVKAPNPPKSVPVAKASPPQPLQREAVEPKRLLPARYRLDQPMIEEGRRLIDKNAAVPMVQASYREIGFPEYLRQMERMGGRLFVGDAIQQRILGEAVIGESHGTYGFFGFNANGLDALDGLALFRPREITGEPLVADILTEAGRRFSEQDLRCVILLPLDREAGILGALKEYLHRSGHEVSQFDVVWGSYFQEGGTLGLKVEKGRLSKTGEIVTLDMMLTM